MAQSQIQEQRQTQGQKLAQSISHQQLLQATLVELPITQLVDRINTEMNDNPALPQMTTLSALSARNGSRPWTRHLPVLGAMMKTCLSITVAVTWLRIVRRWSTDRVSRSMTN